MGEEEIGKSNVFVQEGQNRRGTTKAVKEGEKMFGKKEERSWK